MSTAQVPAIDMNKLNAFIGQFVTDLGAAVHCADWRVDIPFAPGGGS